jgi:CheY-like chemotaxis protein
MVKDTGTGISEEVRLRMFDPFYTTKEAAYGTGMGLSVVYGIVHGYDGYIKVSSQLGKGSEFLILLPYIPEISGTGDEHAQIDSARCSGHVLLIDDEPDVLDMMQAALARLGYAVTAHADALEALEVFKKSPNRFDVVITDQTMPGTTGLALAQKFLSIRENQPIILVTGYSEAVTQETARKAGIKSLIMKPATRNEIGQAIRNLMKTDENK